MGQRGWRDGLLVLGVIGFGVANRADAKAPLPPPGPQTITFTNSTSAAVTCSMAGSSFTLAASSTEVKQVSGTATVTCNGTSFHVDRPVSHHLVRCATGKGGAMSCAEIDPPPTAPPSSVVIENATGASLECTFPGNVQIGVPAGQSSTRRPASGSGMCGDAPVTLSASILVHTVRCVSGKKGPWCTELPIVDTSATPAPAPAAGRVTSASPRIDNQSATSLSCRISLSEADTRTPWIPVPAQGSVPFPIADAKEDILTVECSPPDWKGNGFATVMLPNPHNAPAVIVCTKGSAVGAVVCKAK